MPTLDWIGKKAVLNHHREIPFRLLKCDPALSVGDADAGNLLVEGDNLHALKALLPYYAGRVKCIYIDPPYNTGNEGWVYNDAVNSPEMRAWLGKVVGKEAEDLSRHDKWLCMMYPRLSLLKDFLHDDGAIFVSIDDNEVAGLRILMDEIFGPRNFVASAIWQKRTSRENRAAFGSSHDYVIIYAKGGAPNWKNVRNRLPPNQKGFSNPDGDPKGPWRSIPFSAQGYRPNQMYKILTPTGLPLDPPPGRCWGATEDVFKKYKKENRVYFPKGGNGRPRIKQYAGEEDGLVPMTWWEASDFGDNEDAKKEILKIFGGHAPFDTPKPERLVQRILQIATNEGDLVLDSFLGSGTTAAVAQKLKRRYIGIEMGEHARSLCAKRLSQVIAGDQVGISQDVGWSGGGGFRYCTLGDSLFDERGEIRASVAFVELAAHIFFTETGSPLPKLSKQRSPFLGAQNGIGVYLLFNGVLGDKRPTGGNILTTDVLHGLPPFQGPKVIYGEGCRLGSARLKREGIVFRQIPYQVAM